MPNEQLANLALFPLNEYWWFYGLFFLFVLAMLALDLGVFHREAHVVSFKESLTWSIVWVSLAMVFCGILYLYSHYKFPIDPRLNAVAGFEPVKAANEVTLQFLTGFIIEKSLAVDNIFVFVVVFSFFAIPPQYQHRVLFYGILGALFFRVIFIAMAAYLMKYGWVVTIFGVFLILTGLKILFAPEKPMDPEKNPIIKLLRKIVPVTPTIEGQKFFIRKEGILYATPLFVALVFIEISDIIFAVDSVPAIFAITKEPFIVLTSNVFAILGLRAMYFLLAGVVDKFRYLKYGLGIVLMFVGLKMVYLNDKFGGKFPITWSLGFILGVLTLSILISVIMPPKKTAENSIEPPAQ